MSIAADDHLASQVTRELSTLEPTVHYGVSLVVATLVASPVLAAAVFGQQPVPLALALYLGTLIGAWVVVGLVGGALAMFGRTHLLAERRSTDDRSDPPSPSTSSDSVGSNGAHRV
jgi:hypothetical protein